MLLKKKKKHAPQKHTSDCLHEHKKKGVKDPTKKKSPGTLRNHEQLLSWLPTGGGSTWWAESAARAGQAAAFVGRLLPNHEFIST